MPMGSPVPRRPPKRFVRRNAPHRVPRRTAAASDLIPAPVLRIVICRQSLVTKPFLAELFFDTQIASNPRNRTRDITFFASLCPNSGNPAIFAVGTRRTELVFQCFEILPKPPWPFGSEQRENNAAQVSVGFSTASARLRQHSPVLSKSLAYNLLAPIRSHSRFLFLSLHCKMQKPFYIC